MDEGALSGQILGVEFIREMENGLSRKVAEAMTFVMPQYKLQKFADANHPGSFQCSYEQWQIYEAETIKAIREAGGPEKDRRLETWKEVLAARKAMCITEYHEAAHVLRPSFLYNHKLEDVAQHLKDSLRKVLKEFTSFKTGRRLG